MRAAAADHAITPAAYSSMPRRRRSNRKEAKAALADFTTLPGYMMDNPWIKRGYRVDYSWRQALRSLFQWHTDTLNTWSHLLGFLLFVVLAAVLARRAPAPVVVGRDLLSTLRHAAQEAGAEIHHLLEHLPPHLAFHHHHHHHHHHDHQHQHKDGDAAAVDTAATAAASSSMQLAPDQAQVDVPPAASPATPPSAIHGVGSSGLLHRLDHRLALALHLEDDSALHALGAGLAGAEQRAAAALREALREAAGGLWPVPRWPVVVYLAGVASCLLASASCHLFSCCGQHAFALAWRIDYAFITVFIASCYIPSLYLMFFCRPVLRAGYIGIALALGCACVAVSLNPEFQTTRWRYGRVGVFAGLALYSLVPLSHGLVMHWGIPAVRRAIEIDVWMALVFVAGGAFYALRVPERWLPGKFDLVMHSHQLFHLCVVAGALVYLHSVLTLLRWRDGVLCQACEYVMRAPVHTGAPTEGAVELVKAAAAAAAAAAGLRDGAF